MRHIKLKQIIRKHKLYKKTYIKKAGALSFFLLICTLGVYGCSIPGTTDKNIPSFATGTDIPASNEPTVKGMRDNTPACPVPTADGLVTDGNELVSLDLSHSDCGYFMVQYHGGVNRVKMQVTGPNGITYTYDLGTSYEAFPFAAGNGIYRIGIHENITDNQYATIFNNTYDISVSSETIPYLYPNQYVNFDNTSQVVTLARDLAYSADDDLTVVKNIYTYIVSNVTYDYEKATTVQSGYIPKVDELITTNKGICLDYASAMAAMLRSQRIPTRLEIGYAGNAYHAWISTYLDKKGWVNGIIKFEGQTWELMDPTFAASAGEKKVKDYIGDGNNYVTKYIY